MLTLLVGAYFLTLSPRRAAGEVATVTKGDIIAEVLLSGTVEAKKKATLSFERAGTLQTFPHPVGSAVMAGTVIAMLRSDVEQAAVSDAAAAVEIAKAKLSETRRGARGEELRVKESALAQADVSLKNFLEKTAHMITDAYGKAEAALHTTIDPLFENDRTSAPRLTFSPGNQSALYESAAARTRAEQSLTLLRGLTADGAGGEEAALTGALRELGVVQRLFLTLGDALQDASGLAAETLADYKSFTESARSAASASITALQNQQNAIRDARALRDKAVRELELANAPATGEALAKAEQEVRQAEARLLSARSALSKTVLQAPFAGKIASKNVEIGESVGANEEIASFLGAGGFRVEANVPEADITKIAVGEKGAVTLDAYGDDVVFTVTVSDTEPAEKKIEGVPTYKTVFVFEQNDARLRSGMTANVTLTTVTKKGVLVIPAAAILSVNGTRYVEKQLPDGEIRRAAVTTGSRNNNREIEITSGLREGDRVLIPRSN